MEKLYLSIILLALFIVSISEQSKAPFIQPDTVHQAYSQFQVNLILNQNRNIPIIVTTMSLDKTIDLSKSVFQNAFAYQPGIFFAILIDCRSFSFDLDGRLGICINFDASKKPPQDGTDPWLSLQILTPSQTRIRDRGHTIMKAHNFQLLQLASLNSEQIAKKIRNQLPDFIFQIQDSYDLKEFLKMDSSFKNSKQPKLIYFDTNLLSPVFLRKLGAILDRQIDVAVCDDPLIGQKFGVKFDELVLLQYNFEEGIYSNKTIHLQDNPFQNVKKALNSYLQIGKARDIVIDFQHKNPIIHNVSQIKVINQILSHGRMILLQLSKQQEVFSCPQIVSHVKEYDTMLNYVCLNSTLKRSILRIVQHNEVRDNQPFLILIKNTLKSAIMIKTPIKHLYDYFPFQEARQLISNQVDAQLCIRNAQAAQKDPLFYYLNEKSQMKAKKILDYLNSLQQIRSLFYFCRIVTPNMYLKKQFALKENSIFTMVMSDKQKVQKLQNTNIESFLSIKTIIRQIAIKIMSKSYEEKLLRNQIQQLSTTQQLTAKCFNKNCIVGLIATGRYREEREKEMLKRMKLEYQDLGYQFVWIDGICHFEIGKQLKLLKKKQKIIKKSYVFKYKEKDGSYEFWDNQKDWEEKELRKWIKSLKFQRKNKFLKYTLDLQDKVCKDSKSIQNDQL